MYTCRVIPKHFLYYAGILKIVAWFGQSSAEGHSQKLGGDFWPAGHGSETTVFNGSMTCSYLSKVVFETVASIESQWRFHSTEFCLYPYCICAYIHGCNVFHEVSLAALVLLGSAVCISFRSKILVYKHNTIH